MGHEENSHVVLIALAPMAVVSVFVVFLLLCRRYVAHATLAVVSVVACFLVGNKLLPHITRTLLTCGMFVYAMSSTISVILPIVLCGVCIAAIFGKDGTLADKYYVLLCIHGLMHGRGAVMLALGKSEPAHYVTLSKAAVYASALMTLALFFRCDRVDRAIALRVTLLCAMELASLYMLHTSSATEEIVPSYVLCVTLFVARLAVVQPIYKVDASANAKQ